MSATPSTTASSAEDHRLIWVDMEMTGLDPDNDRVIEVAVVVTDANLETLAEAPVYVIHQTDAVLGGMDSWNTSTHARSGLTEKVRVSTLTEADVEAALIAFLQAACGARQVADVRQLDLPGSSLHGARDAEARGVLSTIATSTSAR